MQSVTFVWDTYETHKARCKDLAKLGSSRYEMACAPGNHCCLSSFWWDINEDFYEEGGIDDTYPVRQNVKPCVIIPLNCGLCRHIPSE